MLGIFNLSGSLITLTFSYDVSLFNNILLCLSLISKYLGAILKWIALISDFGKKFILPFDINLKNSLIGASIGFISKSDIPKVVNHPIDMPIIFIL